MFVCRCNANNYLKEGKENSKFIVTTGTLELGWFIAKFWLHVLKPDTWVKGWPPAFVLPHSGHPFCGLKEGTWDMENLSEPSYFLDQVSDNIDLTDVWPKIRKKL